MSDENAGNPQGDLKGQQQDQGQEGQPQTYDAWLEKQGEDVKGLLDKHTGGLKSALSAERERNKDLERSLREAASKVEKGSESEKRLTELANQANEANRKSSFYESAAAAGVNNLKLAYVAAVSDDLFRKDGSVDYEAIKRVYPELFGKTVSNNAGSGGNNMPNKISMDSYIRAKAGV